MIKYIIGTKNVVRLTRIGFAACSVMDRNESSCTRTNVGAECVAAYLRARARMQSALVYVTAEALVFRVWFKARIALALVTDRFIDASVFARIDGLALVDV